MPNKNPQTQDPKKHAGMPGSDVGKDTDNDGRVVQPGRRAGEVDGENSPFVGKDTDGDGRPVKPGHKPGEIDGSRQKH